MSISNSILFYKARFNLEAKLEGGIDDIPWVVVLKLRGWLNKKYGIDRSLAEWSRFKTPGHSFHQKVNTAQVTATSDVYLDGDKVSLVAEIKERVTEKGRIPRTWVSEYGVRALSSTTAEFSCLVSYLEEPGYIGRTQDVPDVSTPGVVTRILSDDRLICRVGETVVTSKATKLEESQVDAFYELLRDPARGLPVVFVSPPPPGPGGNVEFLVDVEAVAAAVEGNALVCYAEEHAVVDKMNQLMPEGYRCWGGAVRVYEQFRVGAQPDGYRHRYLSPDALRQETADDVISMLRRPLARDIRPEDEGRYLRLETISRWKRMSDLRKRRHEVESLKEDNRETFSLAEGEEKARLGLEADLRALQAELDETKRELNALKQRKNATEKFDRENRDREAALKWLRSMDYPDTVRAVCDYFARVHPKQLAFSERGWKSVEECKYDVETLWRALLAMVSHLHSAYQDGVANIVRHFNDRASGFEVALSEGRQTNKDPSFKAQREDEFEGRQLDITPHVKSGRDPKERGFVRIYYAFDTESQKLVIGHLAGHLDNYSTRKRK
ncbi:MAG: flagellar protein FliT [Bifidobacteriaceae bacterium]|jgi:hypothetical protein|nr:flagellar protein FliT [Bifidobacteriaceae bacterium]